MWWGFILIFIIVQLIKRAMTKPPAGSPAQPMTEGSPSPEDELRRFLEAIGTPQPEEAPLEEAPQPKPPPLPPRPPVVPRVAVARPDQPPPAAPAISAARSAAAPARLARGSAVAKEKQERPASALLDQFRTAEGLRRAVIEREILGPPVGLR